jgi:hypothetical protein
MERLAPGRSVLFVVLVVGIALTGQSTFGATTECSASPGPPAAQGMHWYYRVDRTNNRHCWYLQSAGMQVRSHELIPLSKPRPQIVGEQPLASSQEDDVQKSLSQPVTAEGVLIEPNEPPLGAPLAAHFAARWLDLPPAADLDTYAVSRSDYAGQHASSSKQPMLSTRLVAPETISQLPQKSTNALKFGSVFIAGAISMILLGGLLKLTRVLPSSLPRPRLRSELDDGSEMSLSELMRALRRVDETFKAAETRPYSPFEPRELADERAPKRKQTLHLKSPCPLYPRKRTS